MNNLLHHLRAGIKATGVFVVLVSTTAIANSNPISLATLQVVHEKMPSERMVDGTIEAINQATVSAQTSGRITDIFYDVNDFVPAGAVIMRLRGTQQRASMQQAQASLQEAEAMHAQAQQQFNRIDGLYKEKVATRQEYEQALANRDAGAARLESARAAVEAAKEGFGYTEVRAPYAGIVTKRLVQVGETVQPGTPLMSGVSLQYLRVNLDLPQSIVEKVRAIRKAAIYVNDKRIDATSFTLFPEANTDTHTFHARANLPANATDLHPGMFVKVGVVIGETEKLLIPQSAVVTRSEVTAVYVMQDDHPLLRQVRLGQRFNNRVEVLAGLSDGEIIALNPVAASKADVK
ncbi:MAG TPA: efflux RND transporter periplasmic adaptor subunit [Steroidobacteraceae bacterium]|nr:efflux RND transporter periplasmic adaptor subunit [Steroidobacteraceae bacterium]